MDRLVDHVEHLIAVAGPDHVGIGPDFVHQVFSELLPRWCEDVVWEGMDVMATIPGLAGPAGLPDFTDALLARGLDESTVRKVLGENTMNLFRSTLR